MNPYIILDDDDIEVDRAATYGAAMQRMDYLQRTLRRPHRIVTDVASAERYDSEPIRSDVA